MEQQSRNDSEIVQEPESAEESIGSEFYQGNFPYESAPQFLLTLDEIAAACRKIQKTWSSRERLRRAGKHTRVANMISRTIRVVIADDLRSYRCLLTRVIDGCDDIEVVGEAENGDSAEFLARALIPRVMLMDRWMPGTDSLIAINRICENLPSVHVIGLSSDPEARSAMLEAGAVAFVIKGLDGMYAICDTIRWAANDS